MSNYWCKFSWTWLVNILIEFISSDLRHSFFIFIIIILNYINWVYHIAICFININKLKLFFFFFVFFIFIYLIRWFWLILHEIIFHNTWIHFTLNLCSVMTWLERILFHRLILNWMRCLIFLIDYYSYSLCLLSSIRSFWNPIWIKISIRILTFIVLSFQYSIGFFI